MLSEKLTLKWLYLPKMIDICPYGLKCTIDIIQVLYDLCLHTPKTPHCKHSNLPKKFSWF